MEYLEKILKKNGWTSLITSIVFAILGLILIGNSQGAISFIAYALGIIFMVVGIYKLINYFQTKGKYDFYNYDIAYAIIAILLGVIVIAYRNQISSIFRIIIGVWIIYSSVIRFNLSYKLKTMDTPVWKGCLIGAILMLICGIWVVFTANAIIKTIGVVILIYAILDIIESIVFLNNVNKMI